MFKAYVLREELDRLWTYTTREGVAEYLFGWLKALRWQRLPVLRNNSVRAGEQASDRRDHAIRAYCR